MNRISGDIGEWHCLSQADLAPLIEEELDHPIAQMQQIRAEATSKVEAMARN